MRRKEKRKEEVKMSKEKEPLRKTTSPLLILMKYLVKSYKVSHQ